MSKSVLGKPPRRHWRSVAQCTPEGMHPRWQCLRTHAAALSPAPREPKNHVTLEVESFYFVQRARAMAPCLVQRGHGEPDARCALHVVGVRGRRPLAQQQLIKHAQQAVPCARMRARIQPVQDTTSAGGCG